MQSVEVKATVTLEDSVNLDYLERLANRKLDLEGYDLSDDWDAFVTTQATEAKNFVIEVWAETTKDVAAIAERLEEWVKETFSVEDIDTTTKEYAIV